MSKQEGSKETLRWTIVKGQRSQRYSLRMWPETHSRPSKTHNPSQPAGLWKLVVGGQIQDFLVNGSHSLMGLKYPVRMISGHGCMS